MIAGAIVPASRKPIVATATGVRHGARGPVLRANTPGAIELVRGELAAMSKGDARKLRKSLRSFGHTGLSGLPRTAVLPLRKAA